MEEVLWLIALLSSLIVVYRLIVATAFCWIARKLRGEVNVTRSELATVGIASFFDTVLGLFILATLALTRKSDVDAARRIIDRVRRDLDSASDILKEDSNPRVQNIVRDLKLVSEKLSQLALEERIGEPASIELLENMQAEALAVRDKSDDISIEEAPQRKDKLVKSVEKRVERLKEDLQKLADILT
ncbi:MAG: hypothetical protein DRN99_05770 [Thermoproteota archaeon]|nr:MAG: hypothetical protein DRN99_05770 [Candidatus Korarchaeota archaeon]